MLTATATVASEIPERNAGRITDNRVVRPPSAKISTSPAMPSVAVNDVFENSMPRPDSPINRPMAR